MARQYGFTMSRGRLDELARNIARGVRTIEDYEGYFRQRAENLFPGLQRQIREGQTVRDVLEPYLNMAAEELGIPVSAMATTDQKWLKAINGKDGPMDGDDWLRTLRTNRRYGWDNSNNGRRQGAILAEQLGRSLGAIR
jgi:hypothetical protein